MSHTGDLEYVRRLKLGNLAQERALCRFENHGVAVHRAAARRDAPRQLTQPSIHHMLPSGVGDWVQRLGAAVGAVSLAQSVGPPRYMDGHAHVPRQRKKLWLLHGTILACKPLKNEVNRPAKGRN